MKDIKNYILEAKSIHSQWKKLIEKLSNEEIEWIKKYAIDEKHNRIYTMEELEQRMWKGDLKDQWDKMNNYIVDNILTKENGITQRNVYKVEIFVKGAEQPFMGGTLNCHAAGTVDDPFDTYDMSCCIGY